MALKGIEEDLSSFRFDNEGWWYKDYRIQADPNVHRFVVRYLSENKKGAKILDLGSGNGSLPAQLLDAGFRVSSTSWDGNCNVGDSIYEINLDNGFLPEHVNGMKYNVIVAVDIIEHVENPWAFLRSCSQVLENDGLVIVSTPNIESARSRIEWLLKGETSDFTADQIKYNRHISPISRNACLAMAAQAGLKVIEQYAFGRYVRNSFLKRKLFLLVEKLLPQYASGTTTLYVLMKSDNVLSLGPENIY